MVASKLSVSDFEHWCRQELAGYWDCEDQTEMPSYRMMHGQPMYRDIHGRLVPIFFESSEEADLCSKRAMALSISEIEQSLSEQRAGQLAMPFPQSMAVEMMQKNPDLYSPPMLVYEPYQANRILDAVRTTVLEWALRLEKDGISGEGLSFSQDEQQVAAAAAYQVNQFFAPISGAVAFGSGGSAEVTNEGFDLKRVSELMTAIRDLLASQSVPPETQQELEVELAALESQSSPPDTGMIKKALSSLARLAESSLGAAGGELLKRFPDLFL